MGQRVGLSRDPEFAGILDVEALINFPSQSRNTAAIAPVPAPWQNAPSVLHLSRFIGGGFQVTIVWMFLCCVAFTLTFCWLPAKLISSRLALKITCAGDILTLSNIYLFLAFHISTKCTPLC